MRVKSTHVLRLAQGHERMEVAGENFRAKDANFAGFIPEMGQDKKIGLSAHVLAASWVPGQLARGYRTL
jgi:hypothetical protein